MDYLEQITEEPGRLKAFSLSELAELARQMRARIIEVVAKRGGHLSSNLGVVELAIALHKVFAVPPDKIIWDVGHQCYPHKLLTGRAERFEKLRTHGGLSGFPEPEESSTDLFRTGHAGTAVSSATGLKIGQEHFRDESKVIAVIGDGSLTNGLTLEGLNFLGASRRNLLVILNDNKLSISPTKGALSYYLTRLVTSPVLTRPREELVEALKKVPSIGPDLVRLAQDMEKRAKYLLVPGVFFEKLGLRYFGPIDGHDLEQLTEILHNLKEIKEPVVLHTLTRKGKGYAFAENRPADFHGAGPFRMETGSPLGAEGNTPSVFVGDTLETIGRENPHLVVLTPAMEKGLGLEGFAGQFPDRFFDVGIAEGHCVTMAAGLCRAGLKVVVAMYSTFLQRAFDQMLHDVCLQKLPVVFLVDRAGLVGEDGPTHQGNFDLSFLRSLPGLQIFAPYSLANLGEVLKNCLEANVPSVIRYPRGYLPGKLPASQPPKPESRIAVLGAGSMAEPVLEACGILAESGLDAACLAVDRIKPLAGTVEQAAEDFEVLVTVEENSIIGGFGSAVLEFLSSQGRTKKVLRLGLPDAFVEAGPRQILLKKYGLTSQAIADFILNHCPKQ